MISNSEVLVSYPARAFRLGLVSTLLSSSTLSWFVPLLNKSAHGWDIFEAFIEEFKTCFGDMNTIRTSINRIIEL